MTRLKRFGLLVREGMNSLNREDFMNALFQLQQARTLAVAMGSVLHHAKVHNSIGLVHHRSGDAAAALDSFRQAEALAVEGAGEGNVLHRVIMRNMDALESSLAEKAA